MRYAPMAMLWLVMGIAAALAQNGPVIESDGRQTFTAEEVRAVADELNRRAAEIIKLNHALDKLIDENEVIRAKHPCA
jgi:hypothetical protein